MHKKQLPFIEHGLMNKMMQKNFKDILERVHEDDYSLVKLSK